LLAARAHDCEHWLFSSFETRSRASSAPERVRAKACRLWQRPAAVNRAQSAIPLIDHGHSFAA
jgi:hypothetical protein